VSGFHFVGKEANKAEPTDFRKIISVVFLLSIKLSGGKITFELGYNVMKEM